MLAVYALSPRVTLADRVLVDYSSPALEPLAVFGVTGRFFWPAAYLLVALGLRSVTTRLADGAAAAVLAVLVVIQVADTRPGFMDRYTLTRTTTFHTFPGKPTSPVWPAALPHYRHFVLVLPAHCAPTPLAYETVGYLAGLHGLTMNAGEMARPSEIRRQRYCQALEATLAAGRVADDTVTSWTRPAKRPCARPRRHSSAARWTACGRA